ncbi:hypothetical protein Tco_0457751 [Tanacetum coccineum]
MRCREVVPPVQIESNDKYADPGPPYLILLHHALGPLWEVIRQKVCRGPGFYNRSLHMELAENGTENVGTLQLTEADQGLAAGQFAVF